MKLRIILLGLRNGRLDEDRQTIEIDDRESAAVVSEDIVTALECWTIGAGDTIKIVEVE
jgi:hypothetical protein